MRYCSKPYCGGEDKGGGLCDKCSPKIPLKVLEGEAYFKMLEETAKRVDTWPAWKKG